MIHVRQPFGSHLCGQCCVAIIASITLAESIALIGHRRATHKRELCYALDSLGFDTGRTYRWSVGDRLPRVAILKVHVTPPLGKKDWTHWVAWVDGVTYDPEAPVGMTCEGARLTSYFEVMKSDDPARR